MNTAIWRAAQEIVQPDDMPPESANDDFLRQFVSIEPRLHSYVRSLVIHREDTEDILQEVAIVLWRKHSEFAPGSNFTAWACRVAYHEVLHYQRRHERSRIEFNEELLRQIAADAEPLIADYDVRENALASCLGKLPEDDLGLVRQRHWQGISGRDLARQLGRSESSISRALARAYTRLLACIDRHLKAREGIPA